MKKLLGVSIAAMLAVSPMLARAEVYTTTGSPATAQANAANNITAEATAPYASVDATANTNIATTSYVKGAYNAAIQAVNKVAADASNAGTAAGRVNLATSSTTAGGVTFTDSTGTTHEVAIKAVEAGNIAADAVTTEKILNANVTADKLASDSVTTAKIADGNVTLGKMASDAMQNATDATQALKTKLTTQGYVDEAIAGANSAATTKIGTITDANTTYVKDANTVAENLTLLDTHVKAAEDDIDTLEGKVGSVTMTTTATTLTGAINELDADITAINNKVLPVYGTWESNTPTNTVTIGSLSAASTGGNNGQ